MTIHELHRESFVPRDIDTVFAFFSDAMNLQELTPDFLRFEVLTPAPIEMRVGTLIDYKLRVRGLPIRWQSEITAWEPPHRFVDEQRRGPYELWHHEHSFESRDDGTVIRDHVRYEVRGGILAPLIHRLFVKGDVERIFAYREMRLNEIFPPVVAGGSGASGPPADGRAAGGHGQVNTSPVAKA